MEYDRSLLDIFSSIHSIAKNRELSEISNEKELVCHCGKNHNTQENRDELDSSQEEMQDTDAIYIENTPTGSRFALCPACNPRLNCMLCGGTGHMIFTHSYVFDTTEGQEEYHTDHITPNACSCTRLQILVEKLNQAKVPDKYTHAELNSFQFNHLQDDNLRKKLIKNIEKIENFCTKVGTEFKNKIQIKQKYFITLFGPVGSGKTLLATAALKLLITNYNMSGKFVDFQYLLSELRAEYDEHKTGENILNELRNTDVLIIDEFGKGRNDKEWQLEKLDDLVNYRYNAQKITFITTNYLPQTLKYSDKEIPFTRNKDIYAHDVPINETFWQQSLAERIGLRMYERILEVSEFVDFTELPSYRKFLGRNFLERYHKNGG